MKILFVPDMHCEKCVQRIAEALKKENINAKINLGDKTVTIDDTEYKNATDILDDLGFSVK